MKAGIGFGFRSLPLTIAVIVVLCGCGEEKKTNVTPTPSATASASVTPSAVVTATASAPVKAGEPALAKVPDTVAAQHVLVAYKGAKAAPKGVTRSKADAKKRADEVFEKAKGGTDFSSLVAEYSDDVGSKDRQGSLGKFNRESKVKPFADAAFALAVDQISEPVETDFGFHVIKRNQ